jgi:hypothetical protein
LAGQRQGITFPAFSIFDDLAEKHGVQKVETAGEWWAIVPYGFRLAQSSQMCIFMVI